MSPMEVLAEAGLAVETVDSMEESAVETVDSMEESAVETVELAVEPVVAPSPLCL